eukprot:595894-Rhodomonas_salina.2
MALLRYAWYSPVLSYAIRCPVLKASSPTRCYAVPGTDLHCYAMSGTDLGCTALRHYGRAAPAH